MVRYFSSLLCIDSRFRFSPAIRYCSPPIMTRDSQNPLCSLTLTCRTRKTVSEMWKWVIINIVLKYGIWRRIHVHCFVVSIYLFWYLCYSYELVFAGREKSAFDMRSNDIILFLDGSRRLWRRESQDDVPDSWEIVLATSVHRSKMQRSNPGGGWYLLWVGWNGARWVSMSGVRTSLLSELDYRSHTARTKGEQRHSENSPWL